MFDGESEEIIDLRLRTKSDFEAGMEAFESKRFEDCALRFQTVLEANSGDKTAALYLERSRDAAANGVPDDWSAVERLDFK